MLIFRRVFGPKVFPRGAIQHSFVHPVLVADVPPCCGSLIGGHDARSLRQGAKVVGERRDACRCGELFVGPFP